MFYLPYLPHQLDTHPDSGRIKATIEEMVREYEAKLEPIEDLKADLEQSEKERDSLADDLSDNERTIDDLQSDLDSAIDKIEELKGEISRLETQCTVSGVPEFDMD